MTHWAPRTQTCPVADIVMNDRETKEESRDRSYNYMRPEDDQELVKFVLCCIMAGI